MGELKDIGRSHLSFSGIGDYLGSISRDKRSDYGQGIRCPLLLLA